MARCLVVFANLCKGLFSPLGCILRPCSAQADGGHLIGPFALLPGDAGTAEGRDVEGFGLLSHLFAPAALFVDLGGMGHDR